MADILRTGTTRRWSDTVAYGGLLFLCEVPADTAGDIAAQARQVLAQLDAQLTAAGSGRGRILNATIYLPDPADLAAFNALWDEWIPSGTAPVRACLHAPLTDPAMRIEIQMVAAAGG